jgi:adenylate cyclase
MRQVLSKQRYAVVALLSFLFFAALHFETSQPLMGLLDEGGAAHRLVQNLDGRVTTLLFRARGQRPAHPDVVVVEIDERGAQRYGLWPWPRELMAKALERLLEADAKVIGLDIAFNDRTHVNEREREREWLSTLEGVQDLPLQLVSLRTELKARLETSPDDALEAALKKGGA